MLTPSTIKKTERDTEVHDLLHLWLSFDNNKMRIIRSFLINNAYNHVHIKIHCVKTEYPLYGNNMFLLGSVDAIITFSTGSYDSDPDPIRFICVIDLKPKMNFISSTMAQLNVYNDHIYRKIEREHRGREFCADGFTSVHKCVITSDATTKFDDMLKQNGFFVYHIDQGSSLDNESLSSLSV